MITTATDTSAQGIERASAARVGMIGLIVAEASLFAVFVVAYLYDLGKSLSALTARYAASSTSATAAASIFRISAAGRAGLNR